MEPFIVDILQQGGVAAVAALLVFFYRQDAMRWATSEREDKHVVVQALQANTAALVRLNETLAGQQAATLEYQRRMQVTAQKLQDGIVAVQQQTSWDGSERRQRKKA